MMRRLREDAEWTLRELYDSFLDNLTISRYHRINPWKRKIDRQYAPTRKRLERGLYREDEDVEMEDAERQVVKRQLDDRDDYSGKRGRQVDHVTVSLDTSHTILYHYSPLLLTFTWQEKNVKVTYNRLTRERTDEGGVADEVLNRFVADSCAVANAGRPMDYFNASRAIGKGTYGTVYDADVNEVVKVVRKSDPDELKQELDILQILRGRPNIVPLLSVSADRSVFVFPKFDLNLREFIEKDYPLTTAICMDIMKQLLVGLIECRKLGVIHGDLKPQNCLVKRNFQSTVYVVLSDFGTSHVFTRDEYPKLCWDSKSTLPWNACTYAYRAPEGYFHTHKLTPEFDMFSLGCIWYELVTKYRLYMGDALEICTGSYSVPSYVNIHHSNMIWSLKAAFESNDMCQLWQEMMDMRPDKRPTPTKALKLMQTAKPGVQEISEHCRRQQDKRLYDTYPQGLARWKGFDPDDTTVNWSMSKRIMHWKNHNLYEKDFFGRS